MVRDINGYNGFGLPMCDNKFAVTLQVGVAQSFTVPSSFSKWLALFTNEPGTSIWVSDDGTATIPDTTINTSNSELNPIGRLVNALDEISMITSDTTAGVGVCLYAIE